MSENLTRVFPVVRIELDAIPRAVGTKPRDPWSTRMRKLADQRAGSRSGGTGREEPRQSAGQAMHAAKEAMEGVVGVAV